MEFEFKRSRIDKFSKGKMIDELEKAAQQFNYIEFGWRDFAKVANISAGPVKKEFGGWKKALFALKTHLNRKGLDLSPRKVPPNQIHSDKEMFNEMEIIWSKLGHRPSRTEWELSKSKIHYNTYKQRFMGWQNACLKFIEYKMGSNVELNEKPKKIVSRVGKKVKMDGLKYHTGDTRSVPLNVRLKVLSRDSFRCAYCGRSPATDVGVELHLDHKVPFSMGGKTTIDNLQTLCQQCNLGKSDSLIGK
jgi:5-methylcytosine-specific restriction endonuclease McrA